MHRPPARQLVVPPVDGLGLVVAGFEEPESEEEELEEELEEDVEEDVDDESELLPVDTLDDEPERLSVR